MFRSVSQKWMFQNSSKGGPLSRLGNRIESLRGGGIRRLVHPKSATDENNKIITFAINKRK